MSPGDAAIGKALSLMMEPLLWMAVAGVLCLLIWWRLR